jgi:hypothetical protein
LFDKPAGALESSNQLTIFGIKRGVNKAYLGEKQDHSGQEYKQNDLESNGKSPDEGGGAISIEGAAILKPIGDTISTSASGCAIV